MASETKMFKINFDGPNDNSRINQLIQKWNDHSKVKVDLIGVKISNAFSMYHQTVKRNWQIRNVKLKNYHPILLNDLDTNFSFLIILNSSGKMIHCDLIQSNGQIKPADRLIQQLFKKRDQQYLDLFYCITKNAENYLFRSKTNGSKLK